MVRIQNPKVLKKYIQKLESLNVNEVNEAKEKLNEFIDKGVCIVELVDEFLRTRSFRCIEILCNVKVPYDKILIESIEKHLEENPHVTLILLVHLTQNSSTWISKFPFYNNFFEKILRNYIYDSMDPLLKSAGLYFTSCLLPHCPKLPKSTLELICQIFIKCFEYLFTILKMENKNEDDDISYKLNIHFSLKEAFTIFYGMFPNTLVNYIKKQYKLGKITNDIFNQIIEKFFSSVKFNPILITKDEIDEDEGIHLNFTKPHDIWNEFNNLSVYNEDYNITFIKSNENFLCNDSYLAIDNFLTNNDVIDIGKEIVFDEENEEIYDKDLFTISNSNSRKVSNELNNAKEQRNIFNLSSNKEILDDVRTKVIPPKKDNIIKEYKGKEIKILEEGYLSDYDIEFINFQKKQSIKSEYNFCEIKQSNNSLLKNSNENILKKDKWKSLPNILENLNCDFCKKYKENITNKPDVIISNLFQKKKDKYMQASKIHHECLINLGLGDRFPGIMYDDMKKMMEKLNEKDKIDVLKTRLILVNQHLLFERYSRLMYLERIKCLYNRFLREKNKNKYFKYLELTNKSLVAEVNCLNQYITDVQLEKQKEIDKQKEEMTLWRNKLINLKNENEELKIKIEKLKRNNDYIHKNELSDIESNYLAVIRDLEYENELLKNDINKLSNIEKSFNECNDINSQLTERLNEYKLKNENLIEESKKQTSKGDVESLRNVLICKEDELIRMQQQLNNSRKEFKSLIQKYRQLEQTLALEYHKNKEIKILTARQAKANSKFIETLNERYKTISILNDKQTDYIKVLLGIIEKNKKRIPTTSESNNQELVRIFEDNFSSDIGQFSQDNLRDSNLLPELIKNNTVGQRYLQSRGSGRNSWNNSEPNKSLNINRRRFDSQAENSS
ncbi:Hamartin family-containing protein [Strongyloides ratti]|uniref:Hamartin family-containing protein n=1 Tax=Strongyloides ratti TaxID=34506 RepID=A0A090KQZ4_STRRB|nr:Hamartin family-containing protein [Strongyloides ratti]CEF59794.1 Hamartin family-containing protein [Strongyloides ratti]